MQSTTIGALAKALAEAQAEMKDAAYDRTNPHFKNRYATLASVRAAITAPLAKHGLAVVQTTDASDKGAVVVVTTLMHASGEWIAGRMEMPVAKQDPQGYGSALTYARRYAAAAIVGIASDDDDDGEQATKPAAKTNGKTAPIVEDARAAVNPITDGPSVAKRPGFQATVVPGPEDKDADHWVGIANEAMAQMRAASARGDRAALLTIGKGLNDIPQQYRGPAREVYSECSKALRPKEARS